MKKIITILYAALFAGVAFAIQTEGANETPAAGGPITDAQKTAFLEKVNGDFAAAFRANDAKGSAKIAWEVMFPTTYNAMNMDAVAKPVAEWAVESPADYRAFLDENRIGTYGRTAVRHYIDSNGLLDWRTCSAEQSAAIYDHRKQYDDAVENASIYNSLKSANFISGGFRFSDSKITALAKKYGDLEQYEAVMQRDTDHKTKAALSADFKNYFEILTVWGANKNLDAKVRWKKFEGIEIGFMPFKVMKKSDGTSMYPQLVDAWKDVQEAHQTYRTFYEWNK